MYIIIAILGIIFGLIAIFTGKIRLTNKEALEGTQARIAGIILVAPIVIGPLLANFVSDQTSLNLIVGLECWALIAVGIYAVIVGYIIRRAKPAPTSSAIEKVSNNLQSNVPVVTPSHPSQATPQHFIVEALKNHLQRLRETNPLINPFLDEFLGEYKIFVIAQKAEPSIALTLRDGQQHSEILPQRPIFYHISTLPTEMDQVKDWFSHKSGGYTKFMQLVWNTEDFKKSGCSIWCHIIYGTTTKGIWVQMAIFPVTEDALEFLDGIIYPIEFLTPEEHQQLEATQESSGVIPRQLGKKQSMSTKKPQCKVEFDANGKVVSIEVLQGQWVLKQKGQNKYYTQEANSLLQAVEILKKIDSIPELTYYVVDTPDGSLGRDTNGYYTEAPIKTENLIVESRFDKFEAVESLSLKSFGNMFANQTAVAHLISIGEYARLILLMKCGHCGYESPVETQPGTFVRECYCCGVKNNTSRGTVNVYSGSGIVQI